MFTLLAHTALVRGTCNSASASWPDSNHAAQRHGISGSVAVHQNSVDSPAVFTVKLVGLSPNTLHGIHVHANPAVVPPSIEVSSISSDTQLQVAQTCASCGGHFNPYNISHGSFLNALRGNTVNTNTKFSTQDWEDASIQSKKHHVGDLINNILSDSDGNVNAVFYDPIATLLPTTYYGSDSYSIVGRSIVIHAVTDDLGRQGNYSVSPPYVEGIGI